MEYLLARLGDLPRLDPSPGLRDRLSTLASQRLHGSLEYQPQLFDAKKKPWTGLKTAFAAALLIAVASLAVLFVHLRENESRRPDSAVKIGRATPPSAARDVPAAPAPRQKSSVSQTHRTRLDVGPRTGPQQMTMRLPYSDSAIATGTAATIRVAMSQSELLSLGFPVNATVQDARVVAELTLGDDGLPRAISLPLPLEVIKEKK
jgi:hypothetical protein